MNWCNGTREHLVENDLTRSRNTTTKGVPLVELVKSGEECVPLLVGIPLFSIELQQSHHHCLLSLVNLSQGYSYVVTVVTYSNCVRWLRLLENLFFLFADSELKKFFRSKIKKWNGRLRRRHRTLKSFTKSKWDLNFFFLYLYNNPRHATKFSVYWTFLHELTKVSCVVILYGW